MLYIVVGTLSPEKLYFIHRTRHIFTRGLYFLHSNWYTLTKETIFYLLCSVHFVRRNYIPSDVLQGPSRWFSVRFELQIRTIFAKLRAFTRVTT